MSLSAQVVAFARAGIKWIQIRAKSLDSQTLYAEVEMALSALRGTGVVLIVNDRVDIAALSGVAGVHLGEEDLPLKAARRILGRDKIIGVSTHSLEAALAANSDSNADYIALGPIYPTTSKDSPHRPLGLSPLAALARLERKPIVAIGGIQVTNVTEVLRAGADAVAGISMFLAKGKIASNCKRLRGAVEAADLSL